MTVTHDEYPFDFMIPYNPKDWVLTGILENPPHSPVPFRPKVPFDLSKTDMIAICCEKVLCANNTEAAVRVAAVDRKLKVVFDKLVEPDQPVINYRTSITGLDCFTLVQRNAIPLADIQDKLLGLFHMQTIMVGDLLNSDLKALKMDHARVIDTSLVFNYDLSGGGGGIEKLPRPSLDHLCKSVLGCEIKKSPGRCVHKAVATMKLVLAILKRGAHTSVPLPDERPILVHGASTSVQQPDEMLKSDEWEWVKI
ncbi:small RNA degrading nuclease 2-like [Brassica napus]|nr:PREDICTED: small RNA degrading nuclease 2-like [Brassica oleracea var. oleracea]XP_013704805.1 small RNA degrading nuclease 2-like [Brassica napus]